jgi:hypothetical protein
MSAVITNITINRLIVPLTFSGSLGKVIFGNRLPPSAHAWRMVR